MTLSPALMSQCIRIVAASLGDMICAPLSRDSISSSTPGLKTLYSRPTMVTLSPSLRDWNLEPSMAPRDWTFIIPKETLSQIFFPEASSR